MITPDEIRAKAERFYRARVIKRQAEFPWVVRGRKTFAEDEPLSRRIEILDELRREAKSQNPHGYTIEWKARRVDGGNQMPSRIAFETREDLLSWLGKTEEFDRLQQRSSQLAREFPELADWVAENPRKVIQSEPRWEGLIEVLRYFRQNRPTGLFARELPLSVDTKFIENHRTELTPLLDLVLGDDVIDPDETEFNRRFGLSWVEPAIRMRFLDPALQAACGQEYAEFSLPLLTLASRNWPVTRVLVVENLTSLQVLPQIPGTLGLMGHGKRIPNFRYLKWLETCEIRYWGDIDVQGFEILSSLREIFPQTVSVFMDGATVARVPDRFKRTGKPSNWRKELQLTPEERVAYDWAREGWRRIEQEQLPREWMAALTNV